MANDNGWARYEDWLASKSSDYQKIALHINQYWKPKSYFLLDQNGYYSVAGRPDCIKNEWLLGHRPSDSIKKFDQLLKAGGNDNGDLG